MTTGDTDIEEVLGAPLGRPVVGRSRAGVGNRTFNGVLGLFGLVFLGVLGVVVLTLFFKSWSNWTYFGLGFLWHTTFNANAGIYGALPFIVGTVVTAGMALVIAVPVGIACASYLTEMAPRWLRPLSVLVDLIAAVPSVVIGLWGLLVVAPVFARDVEPFMKKIPAIEWLFHGTPLGVSIFLAGVILAFMVLPTMVALTRTALAGVDVPAREAGMALGATPWQVTRKVVIPGARQGIVAAAVLALGRAIGETIAVTLLIGNNYEVPHSLLAPGATLGSVIINQFNDANTFTRELPALMACGVILLVMGLLVNAGGQFLLRSRFKEAKS